MSIHTAARQRRRGHVCLRGDEAELYATHQDQLWRVVRTQVRGSSDLIDDACASAWAILLRSQPDRSCTLFAWLVRVAVHEAWRQSSADRQQAPLAPLADDDDAPHPVDGAVGRGRTEAQVLAREQLREIAAALPGRKRTVIGLQALGFKQREIAELLGDTERTVDRQLRRAKRQLDPLRLSRSE